MRFILPTNVEIHESMTDRMIFVQVEQLLGHRVPTANPAISVAPSLGKAPGTYKPPSGASPAVSRVRVVTMLSWRPSGEGRWRVIPLEATPDAEIFVASY